MLCIDVLPLTV